MNTKCTKCKRNTGDSLDTRSHEVFRVTNYRVKVAQFTGFPSGETHTVKGWKLETLGCYTTAICPQCLKQGVSDHKAFAMRRLKFGLYCGGTALTCAGLLSPFQGLSPLVIGLLVVTGIALLWVLLWVGELGATRSATTRYFSETHQAALASMVGQTIADTSQGITNLDVGSVFALSPETAAEYANTAKATGWSVFHYLREFAYNSEVCTADQGAAYLQVEHLGKYLESA